MMPTHKNELQTEQDVARLLRAGGYTLRHLAVHLHEAAQREKLYRLLLTSKAWMEAKSAVLEGDRDFNNDLMLAINDFTDPLVPSDLVTLVELHTARMVVGKRVSLYTDADIRLLILLGREAEALNHVRLRLEAKSRCDGLLIIHSAQRTKNQIDLTLLDEAIGVVQTIENDRDRIQALTQIAVVLSESGRIEDANIAIASAEKLALAISYSHWRWEALQVIAQALVEMGRFADALRTVRMIQDDERQIGSLYEIADLLVKAGQTREAKGIFIEVTQRSQAARKVSLPIKVGALIGAEQLRQAWEAADKIQEVRDRLKMLREVAVAFATTGQMEEANKVFAEIEQVSQAIEDTYDRACAFSDLAKTLIEAGCSRQAKRVLVKAGKTARNVTTWRANNTQYAYGSALNRWVDALLAAKEFDKAKEIALARSDIDMQAQRLREVAIAFAKIGRFKEARELAYASTEYYDYRENTLWKVTEALAMAGYLEEAQELAQTIPYPSSRLRALQSIATELAKAGRFGEALETARSIVNAEMRAEVLRNIMEAMVEAGKTEEARSIFSEMREALYGVKDNEAFSSALLDISLAFDHAELANMANNILEEAEKSAIQVQSKFKRIDILRELAIVMAKTGRVLKIPELTAAITDKTGERAPLDNVDERDLTAEYNHRAAALRSIASTLAESSHFTEAEEVAFGIRNEYYCTSCVSERVKALQSLAVALVAGGRRAEADRIVAEAENASYDDHYTITSAEMRRDLAVVFSDALTRSGMFEAAGKKARSIQDEQFRAKALSNLAVALVAASQVELAREIFAEVEVTIQSIEKDYARDEASKDLAIAFVEAGCSEEAQRVTLSIHDKLMQVQALLDQIRAMTKTRAEDKVSAVFSEAEIAIRDIENEPKRTEKFRALVDLLIQAERYEEAKKIMHRIHNGFNSNWHIHVLLKLASALVKRGASDEASGIFAKAEAMIGSIENEKSRTEMLEDFVVSLMEAGRFSQAFIILGSGDLDGYLQTLAKGREAFEQFKPGLSVIILQEAIRIVSWVRPDWYKISSSLASFIRSGVDADPQSLDEHY